MGRLCMALLNEVLIRSEESGFGWEKLLARTVWYDITFEILYIILEMNALDSYCESLLSIHDY